ncbi:MAG: hypothetical protein WC783_00855 [Candidatus Paceibacterota bacterium]|jgi:hypothetical protein
MSKDLNIADITGDLKYPLTILVPSPDKIKLFDATGTQIGFITSIKIDCDESFIKIEQHRPSTISVKPEIPPVEPTPSPVVRIKESLFVGKMINPHIKDTGGLY